MTGAGIAAICAELARKRFELGAIAELKTAPRGYRTDHPRIGLLRRKGLMATRSFGAPAWLGTRRPVSEIRRAWETAAPLSEWLDAHVGPSVLPPPDAVR